MPVKKYLAYNQDGIQGLFDSPDQTYFIDQNNQLQEGYSYLPLEWPSDEWVELRYEDDQPYLCTSKGTPLPKSKEDKIFIDNLLKRSSSFKDRHILPMDIVYRTTHGWFKICSTNVPDRVKRFNNDAVCWSLEIRNHKDGLMQYDNRKQFIIQDRRIELMMPDRCTWQCINNKAAFKHKVYDIQQRPRKYFEPVYYGYKSLKQRKSKY